MQTIGFLGGKNLMEGINKKIKVLLVEDDPLVQKTHFRMLNNFIKNINCEIVTAKDGFIALELIKNSKYNLIFMDIGLPGMTGIDVIDEIRKMEGKNMNIPIIALTAYTEEYHEEAKAAGANEVFAKPIKMEELKRIFNMYIPSI